MLLMCLSEIWQCWRQSPSKIPPANQGENNHYFGQFTINISNLPTVSVNHLHSSQMFKAQTFQLAGGKSLSWMRRPKSKF
ncbi:hypothetical protein ATANTOWER_013472 [Ataeniobius toweri]|uniref:Uncharacterized protein n=1 Tax=Ataeniobius toweri TaxID=208326 RepID=A0ABU7AV78_9TELE|nr:hypothetical protein [Ataeniobius toweri]